MGSNNYPLVWVIMGVSGAGKTLIGRRFSAQMESDFLEGDRRHSRSNIFKMRSHQPLQDGDRQQWLMELEADICRAILHERETVLTCSALKVTYRNQLTAPGRVQLIWLNVPEEELERRLAQRSHHYMKLDMLHSQIEAFEPLEPEEDAIVVNGFQPPDQVIEELLNKITEKFPALEKDWWQRI